MLDNGHILLFKLCYFYPLFRFCYFSSMKKLILVLLLVPLLNYGQKYGRTTVSNVYEVENVNASDLFSRINLVIANMYNSANDVIQLNDVESKKLVIKALGTVFFPNQNKYIYPRQKFFQDDVDWNVNYTLNIAARDGRYRMEINYGYVTRLNEVQGGTVASPYEALIKPTDEEKKEAVLAKQKDFQKSIWALISKKKKQRVLDSLPSNMDEVSDNLIKYSFDIFEGIHQKILESETKDDDDW